MSIFLMSFDCSFISIFCNKKYDRKKNVPIDTYLIKYHKTGKLSNWYKIICAITNLQKTAKQCMPSKINYHDEYIENLRHIQYTRIVSY